MPLELYEAVCKSMRRVAHVFFLREARGRAAVASASCAPQCESSSIMPGSECDGTSWVHVSDPGDGEKSLNRAREPSQQCWSAKLLDVSAVLRHWLDDSAHIPSHVQSIWPTHTCVTHICLFGTVNTVWNLRVKVHRKNTFYSVYVLYTHINAHNTWLTDDTE